MSLNITLTNAVTCPHCYKNVGFGEEVLNLSITHNLSTIAKEVGIYQFLWLSSEFGIETAEQLRKPLVYAVQLLSHTKDYRRFEPANGYGTVEDLVRFLNDLYSVCIKHPQATVRTDR